MYGGGDDFVFDMNVDVDMDMDMRVDSARPDRAFSAAYDGNVGSGLAVGSVEGGAGAGAGVEDELAGAVCELREDVGSVEEVILTHNAFIRKVASEAGIR